jgi:hypothetical protein
MFGLQFTFTLGNSISNSFIDNGLIGLGLTSTNTGGSRFESSFQIGNLLFEIGNTSVQRYFFRFQFLDSGASGELVSLQVPINTVDFDDILGISLQGISTKS